MNFLGKVKYLEGKIIFPKEISHDSQQLRTISGSKVEANDAKDVVWWAKLGNVVFSTNIS